MKNVAKLFAFLKNKKIRRVVIFFIVFLLILGGGFFYLKREGRVFIDDSLVESPVVSVSAQTPGVLNEVDVIENQTVKKGDLLAVVGTQSLRSQTNGVVINASKQIGSSINPGQSVVQIVNPENFRVVGTLDENKGLKDIKVGQAASFTVDAYPGQTFWGYVDEVSPTAKQTQIAFSISSERPTQQFDVYVRYDANKYPMLKNGMSAKLTIFTNSL